MKYSKGDVVFSRCKNELPWPSVITKVALNNRVKVNFFGERFYAYMGMKAVSQFNERNVKKALRRKNAKLIRAVKLAQEYLEKQRQKFENDYETTTVVVQEEKEKSAKSNSLKKKDRDETKVVTNELDPKQRFLRSQRSKIIESNEDELKNQEEHRETTEVRLEKDQRVHVSECSPTKIDAIKLDCQHLASTASILHEKQIQPQTFLNEANSNIFSHNKINIDNNQCILIDEIPKQTALATSTTVDHNIDSYLNITNMVGQISREIQYGQMPSAYFAELWPYFNYKNFNLTVNFPQLQFQCKMRIIIYLENLLENMCLDMLDNSPTERYSLNGNFWLLESTTWTQTDLIYSKIMQKILMLLRLSEMTGNNKYSVEIKYLRQKIVRLEEILKKEEKDDVYESVKQVMLQMVDSMGRHPSKHQEYKQEI